MFTLFLINIINKKSWKFYFKKFGIILALIYIGFKRVIVHWDFLDIFICTYYAFFSEK